MSHSRTVRTIAALALLVGVGTAGCTDPASKPKPLPSPSSSSTSVEESPTAAPSPTPPTLPAEAKGTSARAAKSFVRYWVDVLNASASTRQSSALRAISSDDCLGCMAIADLIDRVRSHDGSIRGKGWDVGTVRIIDRQPHVYVVDALVKVQPQVVILRKGAAPQRFDGGRRLKTFWLERGANRWTVTRLDQPE